MRGPRWRRCAALPRPQPQPRPRRSWGSSWPPADDLDPSDRPICRGPGQTRPPATRRRFHLGFNRPERSIAVVEGFWKSKCGCRLVSTRRSAAEERTSFLRQRRQNYKCACVIFFLSLFFSCSISPHSAFTWLTHHISTQCVNVRRWCTLSGRLFIWASTLRVAAVAAVFF